MPTAPPRPACQFDPAPSLEVRRALGERILALNSRRVPSVTERFALLAYDPALCFFLCQGAPDKTGIRTHAAAPFRTSQWPALGAAASLPPSRVKCMLMLGGGPFAFEEWRHSTERGLWAHRGPPRAGAATAAFHPGRSSDRRVVRATFAAGPITSGALSATLSKWALQPARKVSIVTIPYCLSDRGFADPPALPLGGGRPAEGGGRPVAGVSSRLGSLGWRRVLCGGTSCGCKRCVWRSAVFAAGGRRDCVACGSSCRFLPLAQTRRRSGGGSRPPPCRLSRRRRARRPRTGG